VNHKSKRRKLPGKEKRENGYKKMDLPKECRQVLLVNGDEDEDTRKRESN
jgi:hypothetical protein